MPIRLIVTPGLIAAACLVGGYQSTGVDMATRNKQVMGWFNFGGEWALFPQAAFTHPARHYECTNIVNDTGQPNERFRRYHGHRVSVIGLQIEYDKLTPGPDMADKYLSRRYWKSEYVPNFCGSDHVIIAKRIKLLR
ncbi:MAG: hypothetical protein JO013_02255 [Alphaproteobacteria bacterium]|nr:hypothetical protein [Alphaproteobacteria bacterium]